MQGPTTIGSFTVTLHSLLSAGYLEEAERWREWRVRAVAGTPAQVSIMYGLAQQATGPLPSSAIRRVDGLIAVRADQVHFCPRLAGRLSQPCRCGVV